MHSLDQKDKGNGAGKPKERDKDLQGLYASDFKQVRVCMRSRGKTSAIFKILYFCKIRVTPNENQSGNICVCVCVFMSG